MSTPNYYYEPKNQWELESMDRVQLLNYVTHLQNHTIPDIQREVANKDETIKRMKSSVKRTYEDNDRLINERNTLEDEVERIKKAYVKLNDELTDSIRSREKRIAELLAKNKEFEVQAKLLDCNVVTLVKKVNDLGAANRKLEDEKHDLEDEIEIFKERIKYLESDDIYKEYQKRIEELVKDNNNLGNANDILTVENKDLMKNDELADEKQELDEKCDDRLMDLDESERRCINLTYDDYSSYAKHIAAKVKALEDAGLSHDDAMSLVPIWVDEDFDQWINGVDE